MRFIEDLCPPALLYAIFLAIQLGFDASLGMWATFIINLILIILIRKDVVGDIILLRRCEQPTNETADAVVGANDTEDSHVNLSHLNLPEPIPFCPS